MKVISVISWLLLTGTNGVIAQYIEKKWFDKNDSVYGYYTTIKPSSGRIQGALILIDGFGGNAESFLAETKIHNVACNNDLLTVGIPNGNRLYLDSTMTALLNRIGKEIMETFGLRKDQFAIGGMSSGGTIALRYAELCNQQPGNYPIQPKAVFNVDGPVDLVGLYKSSQRDIKKNNGGWWLYECQMIIDRLKKELGDPYADLYKYRAVSPLLREDKDSVNEMSLSNIAVRTYHDVDADWFIKNRNRSLYETNLLDGSEFINRLFASGNKRAEFITSKIPGQRSNGQRHPHSWNIVEEIELVQWIKKQLHFYPEHIETRFVYTAPVGWQIETILFPIDFSPELSYKGFEELRFAPGWGDPTSGEKWAYTFLWWLDGTYRFDENILKHNLEKYFSGLTRRRTVADKLDMALFTPTKAVVQKIKSLPGDKETYSASADIFDAQVSRKPGKLYFKIHIKDCPGKNTTIVLLEAAANPYSQAVWQQLDKINDDFKCKE